MIMKSSGMTDSILKKSVEIIFMTKTEIKNDYLEWIYKIIYNERYFKNRSYKKLFSHLYNTIYIYTILMDENRADDGIDLRYRFGYENNIEQSVIASYLDDRPCSVLEMIVALAARCEEHIMDNPEIGNRTGKWFWGMIANLKLEFMDDNNYNEQYTDNVISNFLNHKYCPNGEGGLFTVENSECDLRNIEIWHQLCLYLNNVV